MKRIKNIYVKGQPPCLDDSLFFSKTTDFFQTFIPKQSNGSENTIKSYKTGLSMFREYVRDQKGISIRKFKFSDCTYDLFLDYRNWLHDSKGYMESTTNNRLAAIRSYMNYVSARDISLQQIASGIGIGIVVLASQYWGQKRTQPIKQIINTVKENITAEDAGKLLEALKKIK